MWHNRRGTVNRRVALVLLAGLCLATAGPGCSPAGPASGGSAGIPNRLEKMRALRGTGDPRRHGERSSVRSPQKSRPR